MDIEEIERDFIKYIEEHKGIQSTFGTLAFNKSNRKIKTTKKFGKFR